MAAKKETAAAARTAKADQAIVDALAGKAVAISETGTSEKGELSGLISADGVHSIVHYLHEAGFKLSKTKAD